MHSTRGDGAVGRGGSAHPLAQLIPGFVPPADGRVRGIVVAGLERAEVLGAVLAALPATPDGFEAPVYVIEPDETVAARARDAVGLRADQPEATRVRTFVGPTCVADFRAWFMTRLERSLPKHVVCGGVGGQRLVQPIADAVRGLGDEQAALTRSLRAQLAALWAARGIDHWRERYESLAAGGAHGSALVLTSRYSTFVRHSADDLAAALRSMGLDASVLIEPDATATMTTPFYLRAMLEIDPDLVIGINYTRASFGDALPEGWPYVCWVQDAMAHLITGTGGRPGPLDFLAGHVIPGATERLGYTRASCLETPVPALAAKFMTNDRREPGLFTSDIAYASHRSETADALHGRFVRESGLPATAGPALSDARERVRAITEAWSEPGRSVALQEAAGALSVAFGRAGDARLVDLLLHQYVVPMAELILRHRMLGWAASIAEERGLVLRIHGRGWERHPELSRWAADPLEHGDALQESYRASRVHLHASVYGCAHQRVFECLLAGGLPLCLRSTDESIRVLRQRIEAFMASGFEPQAWHWYHRMPHWQVCEHPELMRIVRDAQVLGVAGRSMLYDRPFGLVGPSQAGEDVSDGLFERRVEMLDLLGDPAELTFAGRDELEERVLTAVETPCWRERASAGASARVGEHCSMERFAQRLIAFVGERVGWCAHERACA